MKKAYLWIADFGTTCPKHQRIKADLFFSSSEKFYDLLGSGSAKQLVEVEVPDDFDEWDYIPDSY